MPPPKAQPVSAFNARAFTAITALLSGLGLPMSGLANHLLQTNAITTARHVWMAVHNGLGVLFLVSTIWHVLLNRRALVCRLREFSTGLQSVNREMLWACLLVAFFLLAVIGHALLAAMHGANLGGYA